MRRTPAGGFTLLEIAVALAILGVGIVTCLQIFSGSLRLQDRATRESRAVFHARAQMDKLLFDPVIVDHSEEFTAAGGFQTHILVRHAGEEDGIPPRRFESSSGLALRYLQVDVSWQDGLGTKTYTLKSLRVASEDEG